MGRHSSVERLPDSVRDEIGRLRQAGHTIDEILAHLRALGDAAPSRSALGRHVKKMDEVAERVRRSRQVAEAMVAELGDAPESRTARLNIELLHSAILDLFLSGADGHEADEGGRAALAGNPQGMMLLAKAVDHLSRAKRDEVDTARKIEERAEARARRRAASVAEGIGRARGLSAETVAAIKAGILGIEAPA